VVTNAELSFVLVDKGDASQTYGLLIKIDRTPWKV